MNAGLAKLRQIQAQKLYEGTLLAREPDSGEEGVVPEGGSAETVASSLSSPSIFSAETSQEQQKEPEEVPSSPEPRPFYGDAREDESEAVNWLRSRLTNGPQHIAVLFSEWCADVVGRPSHEISARMDLLNDARWALEVNPTLV